MSQSLTPRTHSKLTVCDMLGCVDMWVHILVHIPSSLLSKLWKSDMGNSLRVIDDWKASTICAQINFNVCVLHLIMNSVNDYTILGLFRPTDAVKKIHKAIYVANQLNQILIQLSLHLCCRTMTTSWSNNVESEITFCRSSMERSVSFKRSRRICSLAEIWDSSLSSAPISDSSLQTRKQL